jgi:hypothetical protein
MRQRGVAEAVAGMELAMVAGMTARVRVVALFRGRSMRCLPRILGDVGDSWRALLLGAPPVLL